MGFKKILSKHKILFGVIAVVVLVVGYLAIRAATPKKTVAPVLPPVKAGSKVIAEGVVVPVQYAALGLQVGGIVGELAVAEGDQVKAGQLLLRLRNQDLQAQVQSAQAGLDKARADLTGVPENPTGDVVDGDASVKAARAALETAKADYDRTKFLFDQGAASTQQLEQAKVVNLKAKSDLQRAQANLAAAHAGVSAAMATLQQAQAALAQTELHASFAGTVTRVEPRVGENVAAGVPVMQLGDLSEWRIETDDLTELSIVGVRPGDPAVLTFDAVPGLELSGSVVRVRAFGEKKKGDMTYTVVIKPDRVDYRLRWNMTATVTIEPKSAQ